MLVVRFFLGSRFLSGCVSSLLRLLLFFLNFLLHLHEVSILFSGSGFFAVIVALMHFLRFSCRVLLNLLRCVRFSLIGFFFYLLVNVLILFIFIAPLGVILGLWFALLTRFEALWLRLDFFLIHNGSFLWVLLLFPELIFFNDLFSRIAVLEIFLFIVPFSFLIGRWVVLLPISVFKFALGGLRLPAVIVISFAVVIIFGGLDIGVLAVVLHFVVSWLIVCWLLSQRTIDFHLSIILFSVQLIVLFILDLIRLFRVWPFFLLLCLQGSGIFVSWNFFSFTWVNALLLKVCRVYAVCIICVSFRRLALWLVFTHF